MFLDQGIGFLTLTLSRVQEGEPAFDLFKKNVVDYVSHVFHYPPSVEEVLVFCFLFWYLCLGWRDLRQYAKHGCKIHQSLDNSAITYSFPSSEVTVYRVGTFLRFVLNVLLLSRGERRCHGYNGGVDSV